MRHRWLIYALGYLYPLIAFAQPSALDFVKSGDTKIARSDHDGAIADCTKATELEPGLASAYSGRGLAEVVLAEAGKRDYESALADSNKAIELDPKNARAYYARAVAEGNTGDLDKALADCNKAIELDPNNAFAYFIRGLAKKIKGDLEGGTIDLRKGGRLRYCVASP